MWLCCVYRPVTMTCCSPHWHEWIQIYGTAVYIHILYGSLLTVSSTLALLQEWGLLCETLYSYSEPCRLFLRGKNCWLAPRNDCFMKEVLTCDRSIYYANYSFKSTRSAMPILQDAVISLSLEQAIGTYKKKKKMLSSGWFRMWHIYTQRENVHLVPKVWIINLDMTWNIRVRTGHSEEDNTLVTKVTRSCWGKRVGFILGLDNFVTIIGFSYGCLFDFWVSCWFCNLLLVSTFSCCWVFLLIQMNLCACR